MRLIIQIPCFNEAETLATTVGVLVQDAGNMDADEAFIEQFVSGSGYSYTVIDASAISSGSVNLSRIDNVVLRMTFPTATAFDWAGSVRIYDRSLNVMKIVSGMAGLMYAN